MRKPLKPKRHKYIVTLSVETDAFWSKKIIREGVAEALHYVFHVPGVSLEPFDALNGDFPLFRVRTVDFD